MTVAIIEDETLAAEKLEHVLREIDPSVEIVARLASVEASISWLRTHRPDLLFVDIHLADGISFSIFEEIDVDAPIIFTTAYDQYAIRAFKVNSIDYLLKPVRKEDVRDALAKFARLAPARHFDVSEIVRALQHRGSSYKERFLIQYGDKVRKVTVEEIAYFFSLEKDVYMMTASRQTYPVDFTLDALQEVLDPHHFFRINRKMIIRFQAIRHMVPYSRSRLRIDLDPPPPAGLEALVSVERAAKFREWMSR